jgi:peptidoglycan/xylan/chitin deacetylase (PgdA/CDA1 family)
VVADVESNPVRFARTRNAVKAALHSLDGLVCPAPPDGLAVLVYHRVAAGVPKELAVAPPTFRRHLRFLVEHYEMIHPDRLLSGREIGNGVLLTFDDGYDDFAHAALPILREFGVPALLYVCSQRLLDEGYHWFDHDLPPGRKQLLRRDDVKRLCDSGLVVIGSHTRTHRRVTGLSDSLLLEEIAGSRAELEHITGQKVPHFAYPQAEWDPRTEQTVGRHYQTAVIAGYCRNPKAFNPLRLFRIPIQQSDSDPVFRWKVSGELRLLHLICRARHKPLRWLGAMAARRLAGTPRPAQPQELT